MAATTAARAAPPQPAATPPPPAAAAAHPWGRFTQPNEYAAAVGDGAAGDDDDEADDGIDMVVTLGGDGLLIHASTLFKRAMPPVLGFNLGSLGFLTLFE